MLYHNNPEQPVHRYLMYASVLDNDAVHMGEKVRLAPTQGLMPTPISGATAIQATGIGDPTELALLDMWREADVSVEAIRQRYPRLRELPFDSGRKLMSTWHQLDGMPDGELGRKLERISVYVRVSPEPGRPVPWHSQL